MKLWIPDLNFSSELSSELAQKNRIEITYVISLSKDKENV